LLTLDLDDPLLSFLRLEQPRKIPLIMDFAEGNVAYSLRSDGTIELHSHSNSGAASLRKRPFEAHPARLVPFTYDQYRAAALASAVADQGFLSAQDKELLLSLGKSYTQVGGRHLRGSTYSPYCHNPACLGHGSAVMLSLVTLSQLPAPGNELDFLPYDPAVEFSLCMTCHSLAGIIIPD
jgi:hypothetical protein